MLPTFFLVVFLLSSCSSLSLDDLLPFGPQVGDLTMHPFNMSEGPFHLPYVFPYFDNNYRLLWITNNGLFSFLQPTFYHYYPTSFPLLNESCLVAGFWHMNVISEVNDTGNKVYYQIHSNTSSSNSTTMVFNKTSNYVRDFFPEQRPFKPKMVIIGTWYDIGIDTNETSTLNNTFQIVLSTDEDRSFVFFLYYNLQWSDPYNYTYYNYEAQAGFHNSERNISQTLPYSGTKNITKLVDESNVHLPGLFAFRVDAETINAGGCNENVSRISFRPRVSSQLGSTPLTIYGPCFTNQTIVKCRFNSSSTTISGVVIDEFRAICLTPTAPTHGSIPVDISIDNGQTFISAGTFTYAPLQIGSDEVIIETEGNDNLLNAMQYVNITWYFSEIVKNTFPDGTKIDIELWRVSLHQQSQLQKDNQVIELTQNLSLIDSIRVQIPQTIPYISTCFIRVVARFNSQEYAGLNTGLLIVRSPSSLAAVLCQNWASQEPEPSTWNSDDLLQCPMTRWQAVAAGRCCYQSDRQCYRNSSNPYNCWLHKARSGQDEPSAVECYSSISRNRHGAGAECCYDNNEMLITRGTGAGTDDRYQPATSPVKHFFYDTVPYLQCCLMNTNLEACNKYMYYRPPRRGSNTMGETGRMWGDPHFGTLDGMSYTFNGYGEYTYLAITDNTSPSAAFDAINQSYLFMSQIRTVPLPSSNATVTKGFAARLINDTHPVSLTISHRDKLLLHRGNDQLEFEDNIDTFSFPELTITRLDGVNNSHFSFSWTIGVTIEINVIKIKLPSEQSVLNIAASVAGSFRNKTYGLLGTYDGIADNDLRSKNGTIISKNSSIERIHEDFGVSWAINTSTSLFYYEPNQSAQFFEGKNREFTPSFINLTAVGNSSIGTICKIDATSAPSSWNISQRTCYYDLYMTNDAHFAQTSLIAGNEFSLSQEKQRNPPLFNLSLPLSMSLKHGQSVNLMVTASSENSSDIVELSALHLPTNAAFNQTTGAFKWTAIAGIHYLSIQARDRISNLTSRHDITFNVITTNTTVNISTTSTAARVNATSTTVRGPNNAGNSKYKEVRFIASILGMIVLLCQ